MMLSRVGAVVLAAIILLFGLIVGFLIGYLSTGQRREKAAILDKLTADPDESILNKLLSEIQASNIGDNLRVLTQHPHLAGTPADLEQAEYLKKFWEEAGLDRTALYPYDVLLSYPEPDTPNRVVLHDHSGDAIFTSQLYEKILRPEQNQSDVVPPFNAYSASGEPRGDLVYVNYGRIEDFIWLTETKAINVSGKICISRYGKIFRGDKARHAERFGCSGLILYTDPADYAIRGQNATYPDSHYLPGTGVQRGTLVLDVGDPLTPGYPSIESAYRQPESESQLPRIPVHPIGYDDAHRFLQELGGEEAPDGWKGDLPITYRLGPGFTNSRRYVQMYVYTHTKNVTTYNAMGFIEGAVEPDRYVLLGNHRDAWVFGAVDPSSGTATMMEVSRAFGKLLKEGWRPRRTIVFCSWGAEEHGLVGSREWIEHFGKLIGDRAVAYLNVDIAVQGNFTFRGRALPMLNDVMYDVAKNIPNPSKDEIARGRPTLYDTWAANFPETDAQGQPTGLPRIPVLGSGSDFAPFISKAGVTCADVRYHYDPASGLSSYPLYHSVYETFHLVHTYYDPDFAFHRAVGQYWGELARRLADYTVIPLDVTSYASAVSGYAEQVSANYGHTIQEYHLETGLEYVRQAALQFTKAARVFKEIGNNMDTMNPIKVRMYNDQLMALERKFLDPLGLPGRPLMRHVVFAPSAHNAYSGSTFPGLGDSLFELSRAQLPADKADKVKVVRKQLSVIAYFVEIAAASLKPTTEF